MSQYVTGIEVDGPLKVGTKYKITTTIHSGHVNETMNEIVAFEKNKVMAQRHLPLRPLLMLSAPTFSKRMVRAQKLILQTDAILMPAGMPSMPGMEDMMKKQMMTGFEAPWPRSKRQLKDKLFFQINIPAESFYYGNVIFKLEYA